MELTYAHPKISAESNPELCFILAPNWKELEEKSLDKISKPVNNPSHDQISFHPFLNLLV